MENGIVPDLGGPGDGPEKTSLISKLCPKVPRCRGDDGGVKFEADGNPHDGSNTESFGQGLVLSLPSGESNPAISGPLKYAEPARPSSCRQIVGTLDGIQRIVPVAAGKDNSGITIEVVVVEKLRRLNCLMCFAGGCSLTCDHGIGPSRENNRDRELRLLIGKRLENPSTAMIGCGFVVRAAVCHLAARSQQRPDSR
jgi:hypothetical protein